MDGIRDPEYPVVSAGSARYRLYVSRLGLFAPFSPPFFSLTPHSWFLAHELINSRTIFTVYGVNLPSEKAMRNWPA